VIKEASKNKWTVFEGVSTVKLKDTKQLYRIEAPTPIIIW